MMKMKTLNLIAGIVHVSLPSLRRRKRKPSLSLKLKHGLLTYAFAHVPNSLATTV